MGLPATTLRLQQLKNYFTMLLLSAGTPMFVMGDEFGRTQGGHDNPYNIDSEVTWVDWSRLESWARAARLRAGICCGLRRSHPPADFRFYGAESAPDTSFGVALAGVVGRRSVRDGQRVVGAGGVRAAGTRPMGDRPVVGAPEGTTVAPRSTVVWRHG